jgi:hypothetical protein
MEQKLALLWHSYVRMIISRRENYDYGPLGCELSRGSRLSKSQRNIISGDIRNLILCINTNTVNYIDPLEKVTSVTGTENQTMVRV